MTKKYPDLTRYVFAVDCIVFGFDGNKMKLLLVKRSFQPYKDQWSLMGGFVGKAESGEDAARRVLKALTGLDGIYLEQLHTFSNPERDIMERTVSTAYSALIDIQRYSEQLNQDFQAKWFGFNEIPELVFDHGEMVQLAKDALKYKAASHPVLFELLPHKFTLPLLHELFEDVFDTKFDKGNFTRKMLSTGLLIKQRDKDKANSKKGAFYYRLDKKAYDHYSQKILKMIPTPNHVL